MAGEGTEYWWATLDILAGREEKKPRKDLMSDVEEWLNKLTAKIARQRRIALETPKPDAAAAQQEGVHGELKKVATAVSVKTQLPEFNYLQTSFGDHIEIEFSFNNPRIRSRLEKLMGSNVVRITDRKYMIKLQERIKEDHLENQKKRIQEREAEEVEREKKLVLEGKIPLEAAPKELKNHPVCKINQITKKILEDKKVKIKSQVKPSGSKSAAKKMKDVTEKLEPEEVRESVSEEAGTRQEPVTAKATEEQITNSDVLEPSESCQETEDVSKSLLLGKDEYEKLKYEAPLVKMLKEVENVEDMYKLAEEIVGPLKHQKTSK